MLKAFLWIFAIPILAIPWIIIDVWVYKHEKLNTRQEVLDKQKQYAEHKEELSQYETRVHIKTAFGFATIVTVILASVLVFKDEPVFGDAHLWLSAFVSLLIYIVIGTPVLTVVFSFVLYFVSKIGSRLFGAEPKERTILTWLPTVYVAVAISALLAFKYCQ